MKPCNTCVIQSTITQNASSHYSDQLHVNDVKAWVKHGEQTSGRKYGRKFWEEYGEFVCKAVSKFSLV